MFRVPMMIFTISVAKVKVNPPSSLKVYVGHQPQVRFPAIMWGFNCVVDLSGREARARVAIVER